MGSLRTKFGSRYRTLLQLAAVLWAIGVCGCDSPRGTPWIEPVLHGWPTPYVGVADLEVHVFDTGKMRLPAAVIHRGASLFENREIEIPAYVVSHPTKGLIVFDTGLAARDGKTVDGQPALGALETKPGQDLASQMTAAGLAPTEVAFVVISHLHLDHTGAIAAFPAAELVVAKAELAAARSASWLDALFFHPDDYESTNAVTQIDYEGTDRLATFDGHFDLLGDASVLLVDLAGHTPGSQGMLLTTKSGPVLLTGDASYVEASWRYGARPLMAYDMDAWWVVSWKIKKLTQLAPSTVVLPGHDLKAARRSTGGSVIYHAFEERDDGENDDDENSDAEDSR